MKPEEVIENMERLLNDLKEEKEQIFHKYSQVKREFEVQERRYKFAKKEYYDIMAEIATIEKLLEPYKEIVKQKKQQEEEDRDAERRIASDRRR